MTLCSVVCTGGCIYLGAWRRPGFKFTKVEQTIGALRGDSVQSLIICKAFVIVLSIKTI